MRIYCPIHIALSHSPTTKHIRINSLSTEERKWVKPDVFGNIGLKATPVCCTQGLGYKIFVYSTTLHMEMKEGLKTIEKES